MFLLYLFHISFNTFFFTSILLSSVCPWSVCHLSLDFRVFCVMFSGYVFIANMVAKVFVPTNRFTSSQVLAYEKQQYLPCFSQLVASFMPLWIYVFFHGLSESNVVHKIKKVFLKFILFSCSWPGI